MRSQLVLAILVLVAVAVAYVAATCSNNQYVGDNGQCTPLNEAALTSFNAVTNQQPWTRVALIGNHQSFTMYQDPVAYLGVSTSNSASSTSFNHGPDLTFPAGYKEVMIVSHNLQYFQRFKPAAHLFVDTVNTNIPISDFDTNVAYSPTAGQQPFFCRAASVSQSKAPSETSWGVVTEASDNTAGCSSTSSHGGAGFFMGGTYPSCNVGSPCRGGGYHWSWSASGASKTLTYNSYETYIYTRQWTCASFEGYATCPMGTTKKTAASTTLCALPACTAAECCDSAAASDVPITADVVTSGTASALSWSQAYYTITIPATTNEVRVTISRTTAGTDPDVYLNMNARPDFQHYLAAGRGILETETVVVRRGADQSPQLTTGTLYIGVYASNNNNTPYTVSVHLNDCFNNCSGQGVCNAGACSCNPGYAILPDCSAPQTAITAGTVYSGSLQNNNQVYYLLTLDAASTFSELFVDMYCTGNCAIANHIVVMAALGRVPTAIDNDGSSSSWYSATTHNAFIVKAPQAGLWYFAVQNINSDAFQYSFKISTRVCPGDCDGQGACNSATQTCSCNPGYSGADCSVSTSKLEPSGGKGTLLPLQIKAYDDEVFEIAVDKLHATNEVEMAVVMSQQTTGNYISFLRAYLLPDAIPTTTAYMYSTPVPLNQTMTIRVPTTQLKEATYYLRVHNTNGVSVNYTVDLVYVAFCDPACTLPRGVCGVYGNCACQPGWQGGDCSVPSANMCASGVSSGGFAGIVITVTVLGFVFGYFAIAYVSAWCCQGRPAGNGGSQYVARSKVAEDISSVDDLPPEQDLGYVAPYAQLKDVNIN